MAASTLTVHVLDVPEKFRPRAQPFRYPRHNKDYGVEQDFFDWLERTPSVRTTDPSTARFHYLPVFWTRYFLGTDFGRKDGALDELAEFCMSTVIDKSRTFTICQYDDGPMVDLDPRLQFHASRKTDSGFDIPLLSAPHRRPWFKPGKRFLASFAGRLSTHPLRQAMANVLARRSDVSIHDGDAGSRYFVRTTLASRIALCPRGYGGSSFRLFKAMALGIAPLVLGDRDTRPFRKYIDWDEFSFFTDDPTQLGAILDSRTAEDLEVMGRRAKVVFEEKLNFGRWCPLVLEELGDIE